MGLFGKKEAKPEPAVNYSEVEQGAPKPAAAPDNVGLLIGMAGKLLENQKTIVQNQQVILDAVNQTQELIVRLANTPAPEPEPQPEQQEEELPELPQIKAKARLRK